jgi:hypothetical protein
MRKIAVAVCIAALILAASGCDALYTPPTPHISGPDSGFINVPVEFTAEYSRNLTGNTSTYWDWDDGFGSVQSWELVVQHTYKDTGTHIVTAGALRIVTNFFDYHSYYESGPSNPCTLRIIDTTAVVAGRQRGQPPPPRPAR